MLPAPERPPPRSARNPVIAMVATHLSHHRDKPGESVGEFCPHLHEGAFFLS